MDAEESPPATERRDAEEIARNRGRHEHSRDRDPDSLSYDKPKERRDSSRDTRERHRDADSLRQGRRREEKIRNYKDERDGHRKPEQDDRNSPDDDRRHRDRNRHRERDSLSDHKRRENESRSRKDEMEAYRNEQRLRYDDDRDSSDHERGQEDRTRSKRDGEGRIEESRWEDRGRSRKHQRDGYQDRHVMSGDEREGLDKHRKGERDRHLRNGESDTVHRRTRESDEERDLPGNGEHRKGDSRNKERGRSEHSGHRVEEANGHRRKGRDGTEASGGGEIQIKENNSSTGPLLANDSNGEKALGRSGGVYIPPFKLAQMMKDVQDKSSVEYQRMTWDALRKSINGLVNKVNASNIKNILPELFSENLIRGRGLFARSCMKSQMASPAFTHVFAGLVAVVNTKFPELGELLLKRVILQFRRALKRNDKPVLLAAAKFIAHLVNQQVAHEVVALEVLMVLLENPTDDSVEVAVGFVKECGAILQDLAPKGLHGIFGRFRGILHEGEIDKRVQFMIEGLFAIRKANFQGHPAILPELDLVEQEDQFTHEISLSHDFDAETGLDIFKPDPNFVESEKKYETIKKDILGEESDDDGEEGENESDEDSEDDDDEEDEAEMQQMRIKDETETNLVNLRRTIYLTIMSSVDFEEAGHKLLKIKLEPGQEMELCIMLLECCSQERTYLRYYGLLGQRFCMINKVYQENFDECFVKQYSMIHRLETNKLRNVAKFFAHLLGTDALPWNVLAYLRLTEEDTTSSSRIFIKILFQELSEHLGLRKLNERLNDPITHDSFDGIFPKDNPKNTRFAINFFTSIGLGGITDSLREYLKNMPRLIMQQQKPVESETEVSSETSNTSESETSSSESDSESESSSSESESQSEDSDEDKRKKRRKRE